VGGIAQVAAVSALAVLGTRVVELAGVEQAASAIEEEKIRRAGCTVGERHFLGSIDEVGEVPTGVVSEGFHELRSVLRVFFRIVRIDDHGVHALGAELIRQCGERLGKVDDVRAMVAGKDNQSAGEATDF